MTFNTNPYPHQTFASVPLQDKLKEIDKIIVSTKHGEPLTTLESYLLTELVLLLRVKEK